MSEAQALNCVQISDEALTDARRVRDLLMGAMASRTLEVVRPACGEASAIAAQLVDKLERFFAVEYERQRAQRAHELAQAAKHVATAEVRR